MARMARLVIPKHPHHVIQRGVRGMEVFLQPGDYRVYLDLLREWSDKAGTRIWAYCLMPNHVHLVLVPSHEDGLRAAVAETHRRFARHVNRRQAWTGHLWQERFHSFPMDEAHLLAAARYVELNPVRAKLVKRPEDWKWSSAKAHLAGTDDEIVAVRPMLRREPDWRGLLDGGLDDEALETMRRHVRSGHPAGSKRFYGKLEKLLGRDVMPRPPGRPKKAEAAKRSR